MFTSSVGPRSYPASRQPDMSTTKLVFDPLRDFKPTEAIQRLEALLQQNDMSTTKLVFDALRDFKPLEETCIHGTEWGEKITEWEKNGLNFEEACKKEQGTVYWHIAPDNHITVLLKVRYGSFRHNADMIFSKHHNGTSIVITFRAEGCDYEMLGTLGDNIDFLRSILEGKRVGKFDWELVK